MPLVASQRMDQLFADEQRPVVPDDAHDALFRRARALSADDRLLLELTFKKNLSVRQIGRLMHLPAGTISRRVNRLCARLRDPIVAALLESDCLLTPHYRAVAIQYFAQGLRIDSLAREHQIPAAQVRSIIHFVRGWYRGIHVDGKKACT